ncbi:MAG: TonB-dependent receptor, partial [Spirulina sp.]
VEYGFSPDATIYGSITRGYKPAGLNFRANSDDTLAIGEERSWNYELGVKTAWFDDRLIANLAVFHNVVDDFQVGLADITGLTRNIANAQVSITGLELELKARPADGLDITAGFGYTDAKYDSFFNPFTGQTLDGNKLSFAPEYTINFATQYRAPWGLFARVEWNTLGSYFTEETNVISQGTVSTVNATLGYEFEDDYGIYFVANNIFDTRFLTFGNLFGGVGGVGTYNPPFTARLLFKTSF